MSEDWMVDSLIGFLQSPVWSSPVNDFIDENCVVFDPGDENKLSYTEVHNAYTALVEKLLGKLTTELGITVEQLGDACVRISTLGEAYRKQLEHVIAAENFLLFKSLMVQKNIDLELQALNLLKEQLGHAPDAYDPNAAEPSAPQVVNEDDIFQKALKESKREFESQKSLDEEEMKKLMDLATQESLRLFEASEREKQAKIESNKAPVPVDTSSSSQKPEEKKPKSEPVKPPAPKQSSPAKQTPLVSLSPKHTTSSSTSEAASMWLQSAKEEFGGSDSTGSTQQKVAVQVPADLKSREAYLKRQRDHLLKIKRQARAKELDAFNTTKAPSVQKFSTSTPQAPKPATGKQANNGSLEKAATSDGTGEKKFQTGVLCSVIAHKLKEQQ